MHVTVKKCFGLTLVSGLLLLSLLQVWNSWTSPGVDIQPRQGSLLKLLDRKIQDIMSGYRDIAYHIKVDVARWVIDHSTSYFVHLLLLTFIFVPLNSLSKIFPPDVVIWLKMHACVGLRRRPSACRSLTCCSHLCGPIMLALHSWSPNLTQRVQSIKELRSTTNFRRSKCQGLVCTSWPAHICNLKTCSNQRVMKYLACCKIFCEHNVLLLFFPQRNNIAVF